MPYITIESGVLSDEQKEDIISRLTEAASEIIVDNLKGDVSMNSFKIGDTEFGIGDVQFAVENNLSRRFI